MKEIKQAVLFVGGKGTRMGEQSEYLPKPLSLVDDEPIVVHIMRQLAKSGIEEFILLTGYMSDKFVEYFSKGYLPGQNEINFSNKGTDLEYGIKGLENCKIKLLFTGKETGTAERLLKAKEHLNSSFVLTYGDSYGDVNMEEVEEVFLKNDSLITITGIEKQERFGIVLVDDEGNFKEFKEKQPDKNRLINGGFMCVNKNIFNYYKDNANDFMKDVMQRGIVQDNISIYRHKGYWKAVDTQEDLRNINNYFKEGIN